MKVRAEDLCAGHLILGTDNSPITIEGIDSRGSQTHVYITTKSQSGGVFAFKAALDTEFFVAKLQLWSAVYSHEYGADSYLFLVNVETEISTPVDETKVAKLLGLDFNPGTEVIHAAQIVNCPLISLTHLRDGKGKTLPLYVD